MTLVDAERPNHILLAAIFGAVLVGGYALYEELLWTRYVTGIHPYIIARVGLAALLGAGLAGGIGGLAAATAHVRRSGEVGALLLIGSVVVTAVAALRIGDFNSILGLASVLGITGLIGRRLDVGRDDLLAASAELAPYVVAGVAAAFGAAWIEYSPDRFHRAEALIRLLLLAWNAATIAALFYLMLARDRRHVVMTVLLPVVGVLALGWLPPWFFGRVVALKLCALVYAVLGIGVLSRSAVGPPRLTRALVAVIAIWGCGGAIALGAASVPDRFGPLDTYSLGGLLLAPVTTDADGDTFFAATVGGSDRLDRDNRARPTDGLLTAAENLPPTGITARHVIIVVADAMRADTTYGLADAYLNTAPGFVRFERAYSPGNATNVSLPAMVDGSAPGVPGAPRDPLFAALPDDVDRHFAVFTDLEQVWEGSRFSVPEADFTHLTDADDEGSHGPAALDFLKQRHRRDRPRTLTVLYLSDPHAPYMCAGGGTGEYDCYVDELRRIDMMIRGLCEHLDAEGLREETVLMVSADHGEEFGEHGYYKHATNLFEEQIHVPLYMWGANLRSGAVATPVAIAGVAATTRELFGAPPPQRGYPSLLPLAVGHSDSYPAPIAHHWEDEEHDVRVAIRKSAFVDADAKLMVDWRTMLVTALDLDDRPIDDPIKTAALIDRHVGDTFVANE